MSIVRINAITVPAEAGDELAERFAKRAGSVDQQPGFEGFQLLKPTDDRDQWLVVTWWADQESFDAWVSSQAFQKGHANAGGDSSSEEAPKRGPVGTASELWSYEVAQSSMPG